MEFVDYESSCRAEKFDCQNKSGYYTCKAEKLTQKSVDETEEGGNKND